MVKLLNKTYEESNGWQRLFIDILTTDGKRKTVPLIKKPDADKWNFQPCMNVYRHEDYLFLERVLNEGVENYV